MLILCESFCGGLCAKSQQSWSWWRSDPARARWLLAECVNKKGTALLLVSVTCLPTQVGNHIDIVSTKWVAQDAGIGAGVDSYFEYLVKGAVMLQDEELLSMFQGNSHSASSWQLLSNFLF